MTTRDCFGNGIWAKVCIGLILLFLGAVFYLPRDYVCKADYQRDMDKVDKKIEKIDDNVSRLMRHFKVPTDPR